MATLFHDRALRRAREPEQDSAERTILSLLLFKVAALPLSILALFLLYWLLPNCKVDRQRVAPMAILVGLALEAMQYVNLLLFPLFREKLQREYGVFQHSALMLLWSFAGGGGGARRGAWERPCGRQIRTL
jgi:uncharacterized BrkB/YihY/UPF0761 family membrane protein